MSNYDFTATADFLNCSVPLASLYDEVCAAWHTIGEKRLTKEKKADVWSALLAVCDFLDTIKEVK